MRLKILVMGIVFVPLLFSFPEASVEFVLDQQFTVPGSARPVTRFIMGDIDNDLLPEALLLVGSTTYLFSISGDSTIFENTAEGTQTVQAIALGDVNRDSIPDVIISTLESPQTGKSISRVFAWDGASQFTSVESYTTDTLNHGQYFAIARHLLTVLDLDNDGYNELVFSYDSSSCLNPSDCLSEALARGTVVFRGFPNTIYADPDFRLTAIDSLMTATGEMRYLATERRFDAFAGTGRDYIRSYLDLIDPWTDAAPVTLLQSTLPAASTAGTIDPCQMIAYFRTRGTGNLLKAYDGDELLVEYQWDYSCAQEGAGGTTAGRELRLYRFSAAGTLTQVWALDIDGIGAGPYFVHPGFSGGFFMIRDGKFITVNGPTGQPVDTADTFPSGVLYWLYPYSDGVPRLVALNGYDVSVYSLDISTAVGDDDTGELPQTFSLSEPYPNPFNPSVSISIMLPIQSELTLAVYNALGQEVALLFQGKLPAGEQRTFVWNATGKSSGVYFIKAATSEITKTKKAVLLK
jgi:hypothetical protein